MPEVTSTGRAFLGAAATPRTRRYVYGFRDRMDERYDMLRGVRDKRYKYIRNYMPHVVYAQYLEYMYEMPTMRTWQRLYDEGKLVGPQRYFFEPKPTEELYDTWADPHEVHNLALSEEYHPVLERLRGEERRWVRAIHDTGFLPEAEIYARSGEGSPYEMARDPGKYPQERIIAAADLAGERNPASVEKLVAFLKDEDSAVRYWGAVGLAALGARSGSAAEALFDATRDPSPSVRVAAADALCKLGRHQEAVPVLVEGLGDESEWVRLRAAIVLDGLDERARPVLAEMKAAFREGERNYPNRVLVKVFQDLEES